jgi:outer membrane protein
MKSHTLHLRWYAFRVSTISAFAICVLISVATAFAQNVPPASFTLDAAVNYALEHYPAVRAALEREAAASAQIGVARTSYLPRADALWQANRATHNNFFGLLIPQNIVPSISGPVSPGSSNSSAWDSAAGLLVSWQPFDFGYRTSKVNVARAGQSAAQAQASLTRLDVASAVVAAYINLLSAQQQVIATQADVDRRQQLATQTGVLVKNELRPGADASRAEAEFAAARVRLIQATTAERVARIAFADLLGITADTFNIGDATLSQLPPADLNSSSVIASHPSAEAQDAQARFAQAQLHAIDRSYFPKFYLQSSVSGRGTGVNTDGSLQGGASGLNMQRENWAVGAQVTFSLMDIFNLRAQKQVAAAEVRAEKARYEQTVQDLNAQAGEARAAAAGARSVAEATPIELHAAREGESQARARYNAGLSSIAEVADAQSLLIQAETGDAIAKLSAWSSLASVAVAQGDLEPFLKLVREKGNR